VNRIDWLWQRTYGGVKLETWLIAALVALAVSLGLGLVKTLLARRLQRWGERTSTRVDNVVAVVLRNTRTFFVLGVGLWAGSEYVELSATAARWVRTAVSLIVLTQIGIWLQVAIQYFSELWGNERQADGSARTMATAVVFIAKLAIWSVLFVMALSSLGFEISALVTGLGVGGVAAALAVQSLLVDLLASLSMFFDRPFNLGDFIVVGEEKGTVERIGLRSTRLRALGGEEIVFANGDLIKSRIHNHKRMQARRVSFTIGVAHATSGEALARIPALVQQVIESREGLRFERAHFREYSQNSLDFEIVYFVESPDFKLHMDHRQAINLQVLQSFRDLGIQLAGAGDASPPAAISEAKTSAAPRGPKA
jgi:small-conductance mechanosensitive channel